MWYTCREVAIEGGLFSCSFNVGFSQRREVVTLAQPRVFKDSGDFLARFEEYLKWCDQEERIASDEGFMRFAGISHDTFYAYLRRYPDDVKATIRCWQRDIAVNNTKRPAMSIFYLKNAHGWRDHPDQIAAGNTFNIVNFDANNEQLANIIQKLGYKAIDDGDKR
jgi:hypothetical protein